MLLVVIIHHLYLGVNMSNYAISEELLNEIMPQKYPMRFVDGLIEFNLDEKNGKVDFTVGKNECIGLDPDGNLPVFCLIEVMAQAVSAFFSYVAYLNKEYKNIGLLLSVRSMNFKIKGFVPKGTQLISTFQAVYSDNKIEQVAVTTCDSNGNEICGGLLTVLSPDEQQIKELLGI